MTTTHTIKPIKLRIDNQRGSYTGEIADGLVRNLPDGYGTAKLDDGFTLKGRFKSGNFVQGTAESDNVFIKGNFDNLQWLGGDNGYIKYNNGDIIEGEIDPITKELIIRRMTSTQECFGDIVNLHHQQTADGKNYLVGELTTKNGDKMIGTFRPLAQQHQVPTYFGIPKMDYICEDGDCKIYFHKTDTTFAKISGRIRTDKNNISIIDGEFGFANDLTNTSLKIKGQFQFDRDRRHDKQFDFSEKFATMFFPNDLEYHTTLTLQDAPHTIIYETLNGKFVGQKKFLIDKNSENQNSTTQPFVYVGTMTSKNGGLELAGTFDSSLKFQNGKIRYIKGDEIINLTCEQLDAQTKNNRVTIYRAKNATGEYQSPNLRQKGDFVTEFTLSSDYDNIVNTCSFAFQPILTQGEIQHALPDRSYFEGKLTPAKQKDFDNLATLKRNRTYMGEFVKTDNSGKTIFRKTGVFGENYTLQSGSVYEININDSKHNFDGTKDTNGYYGTLSDPRDGSYENGNFDSNLNFLNGKFKIIYDNEAIFEGETPDLITANGILFRNGDFIQKGEFSLDWGCPENPTFERGKLLVRFDDKEQTYCEGIFDRNGLQLTTKDDKPLFADDTYLLNFKNSSHPNGLTITALDLTDAYTQFLTLSHYTDLANISQNKQADTVENSHTAPQSPAPHSATDATQTSQKADTPTENNTPSDTQDQGKKISPAGYDDIVQIAGQIIHIQDATTQPFDPNIANNVMSKLINPNKEHTQSK